MSQANHGALAKNTVFLYFRLVLTLGISLFTSRQVLAVLGIEDYGIYNVVAGAIVMLSFLNGAMTTSTQRFLSIELGSGRRDGLGQVFGTAVLLHLGVAVVVLLLAETVGLWLLRDVLTIPDARVPAARWVFQFALLSFLLNIIQVPYTAAVVANERMDLFAYLGILDALVKLVNVYILIFVDVDKLVLYGLLNVSASLVITFVYMSICRNRFPECRAPIRLFTPKLKEMFAFVGWNAFSHVAVAAGVYGVNILLNVFFGPVVNAARGIAMLASDTIKQFANAFQVASAPQITKTYASGERDQQRTLVLFACKSTFFLLFLLALPVFMEADRLLRVWLGEPPPDAALFLRLILCDALICTSANPMYYAIMAAGNIGKYQLIGGMINLTNFGVSWILLKNGLPAYSVFCVLIGISFMMLCLRLWFLKRRIEFSVRQYVSKVMIPGVRVLSASIVVPTLLVTNMEDSSIRLALVFIACFLGALLAIYFFGLDQRERSFLRSRIKDRLMKAR